MSRTLALLLATALAMCCQSAPQAQSTPRSCGASGGLSGSDSQLRFVDVNDGQVVFTFGPSPVSNAFAVPAYILEETSSATGLSTLGLTFHGTSLRYPDGTTSYNGPLRIGVNGQHLLEAALASDVERTMTWRVTPKGGCPRVSSKSYVYGKSPRAQLALTFGGVSAFTLESTSDFIGTPQDTPVQASGMGFAPSTTIVITAADKKLWDTTSDRDGNFDSGFNVGYPAPGVYTVTANDGQGHTGTTRMTVILPTNPFHP